MSISFRRLKKPEMKSRIVDYDNRDLLLQEQSGTIKSLQKKLMILSKGYYDLNHKNSEISQQNAVLHGEISLLRTENHRKEVVLETEKENSKIRERTIRDSLPTLGEKNERLTKIRDLKNELAQVKHELRIRNERLEDKYDRLKEKHVRMQEKTRQKSKEISRLQDILYECQNKLNKTVRVHEEGVRKKMGDKVRLNSRVSNLSKTISNKNEEINRLKTRNRGVSKKLHQYKEWSKTIEHENSKTARELLQVKEKYFKIENKLREEIKNSRQREDLITDLQETNYRLRQKIREFNAPKIVLEGKNENNMFLDTVRDQVTRISAELNNL